MKGRKAIQEKVWRRRNEEKREEGREKLNQSGSLPCVCVVLVSVYVCEEIKRMFVLAKKLFTMPDRIIILHPKPRLVNS